MPDEQHNGEQQVSSLISKGKSTVKAGKGIKKTTKAVKKIVSKLAKAIKWLASIISSNFPVIISVVLLFVFLFFILAVLARELANLSVSHTTLTPEGEVIMSMFESYTDEKYRTFIDTNGIRVRRSTAVDNPDNERNKYKQVIEFVKNNNYDYILCGIWSTTIKDIFSTHRYLEDPSVYSSSDDVYKQVIQFYYEEQVDTDNPLIGFESSLEPDEYSGTLYHQFYTNEMFKACLDAFVNEDGSYISTYSEIHSTSPSNNLDAGETETNTGGIQDYSAEIIDLVYDNLIRGLENRYSFKGSSSETFLIMNIKSYYRQRGNLNNNSTPEDADRILESDYKVKLKGVSSSFLTSGGIGDVNNLVRLARGQIGNGGQMYCDKLYNGVLVDWCAIYAGWLMQEGGGLLLDTYGWSASVPTWQGNLQRLGIWHERESSYQPKVGDIVIFGNNSHVGIAIEVTSSTILVSEGNTDGSSVGIWCHTSKVSENNYSLTNSYIKGYGEVTYRVSEQLYDDQGRPITGVHDGAMYRGTSTDSHYKCLSFYQIKNRQLTNKERKILEQTVFGEYGNDRKGAYLIAQCMRDALAYGYVDEVENIPSVMRYDGYYANSSGQTNDISRDAVRYIFDWGGMAVQHRILVMYNPDLCVSEWHETQNYIISAGSVRFFDYW